MCRLCVFGQNSAQGHTNRTGTQSNFFEDLFIYYRLWTKSCLRALQNRIPAGTLRLDFVQSR